MVTAYPVSINPLGQIPSWGYQQTRAFRPGARAHTHPYQSKLLVKAVHNSRTEILKQAVNHVTTGLRRGSKQNQVPRNAVDVSEGHRNLLGEDDSSHNLSIVIVKIMTHLTKWEAMKKKQNQKKNLWGHADVIKECRRMESYIGMPANECRRNDRARKPSPGNY